MASALLGMSTSTGCSTPSNYWRIAPSFAGPCLYEGTANGSCGSAKLLELQQGQQLQQQQQQLQQQGHAAAEPALPRLQAPMQAPRPAAAFDSHSDWPWFMLDARRLAAAFPHARLVRCA